MWRNGGNAPQQRAHNHHRDRTVNRAEKRTRLPKSALTADATSVVRGGGMKTEEAASEIYYNTEAMTFRMEGLGRMKSL